MSYSSPVGAEDTPDLGGERNREEGLSCLQWVYGWQDLVPRSDWMERDSRTQIPGVGSWVRKIQKFKESVSPCSVSDPELDFEAKMLRNWSEDTASQPVATGGLKLCLPVYALFQSVLVQSETCVLPRDKTSDLHVTVRHNGEHLGHEGGGRGAVDRGGAVERGRFTPKQ